MKILCPCGGVIRDQSDALPTKGRLRPDAVEAVYLDRIAAEVASLLRTPAELRDDLDVALVAMVASDLERVVYECPNCGRLLVETPTGSFAAYTPESEVRGVLRA